jgi:hypothetical protein
VVTRGWRDARSTTDSYTICGRVRACSVSVVVGGKASFVEVLVSDLLDVEGERDEDIATDSDTDTNGGVAGSPLVSEGHLCVCVDPTERVRERGHLSGTQVGSQRTFGRLLRAATTIPIQG